MRLLLTGDLHLGREYKKQAQENRAIAERYQRARIEALESVIRIANAQSCDYLVIAGDLYDSRSVSAALQQQVCSLLADSGCPVLVLPGNHDYCDGADDPLWARFRESAGENTILLSEPTPLRMGDAVFYPCPCRDRYSESNALDWLRQVQREPALLHIGIAHGAIEGLSCDREKRYYYMTREELEACGMDLWLIGHTHVPYPDLDRVSGQRIFNAGTHQQTDIADGSVGSVFLIEIDNANTVTAQRIETGVLHFVRSTLHLSHGDALADALSQLTVQNWDCAAITLRLYLSGIATAEDYGQRSALYAQLAERFLKLEVFDDALQQEITPDMIDAETIEGTPEHTLLHRYANQPELLNLAFDLIRQCKEEL